MIKEKWRDFSSKDPHGRDQRITTVMGAVIIAGKGLSSLHPWITGVALLSSLLHGNEGSAEGNSPTLHGREGAHSHTAHT